MIPYAAKVFRDYLADQMPGVRVSGDVPATVPAQLVTIRQVPAGSTDKPRHFGWRRLILRCRHRDGEIAAGGLAETVRDLMVESKYAGLGVRDIDVIGEPGRFDDPDDSTPWFQLTVDALFKSKH